MTTIIVTRPKSVIQQASEVYRQAGFSIHAAPCFDIQTNESVQAKWLHTSADIWVILSVHALHHALIIAPDWQPDDATRVIGVGPAVVKAWQQQFNHPIESHPLMNSEGVIKLLDNNQPQSIQILSTADGRVALKTYCMQKCISYSQINTYQRVPLEIDSAVLINLFKHNEKVILTATSVGVLTHFMSSLTAELKTKIMAVPLVVGSHRIKLKADEIGFTEVHVAESPSDTAMCEMVKALNN